MASVSENSIPSMATVELGASVSVRNSVMVGVDGFPSSITCMGVPASCAAAWSQYRESAQRYAWSVVTRRSPAEPVNPESHRRTCQCAARYSLWCGSVCGMITACMPCAAIFWRRAFMRVCAGFCVMML